MKQRVDSVLPPVIILAGGKSERYGSPKGLAIVGSNTLLFSHISTYAQIGTRVVVVLGFYTEPYISEIERAIGLLANLSLIADYTINEAYDLGPFSSVQCGIRKLSEEASRGVFIQPVDTGIVSAGLFNDLFNQSKHGEFSVVPEWQGKGGHPVFISADLTNRLLAVDPRAEAARLDLQLRAESNGKVLRLPVAESEILENRNITT